MTFSTMISEKDRARLRHVVRVTHKKMIAGSGLTPTDGECDLLIDSFAPEVAEKMVRLAVDAGNID